VWNSKTACFIWIFSFGTLCFLNQIQCCSSERIVHEIKNLLHVKDLPGKVFCPRIAIDASSENHGCKSFLSWLPGLNQGFPFWDDFGNQVMKSGDSGILAVTSHSRSVGISIQT
jgi:hypothetical protein